MAEKFLNKNYEVVPFDSFADIYIINTCTVTSISDKKSRQIIRRAKQLNKAALVIATGCYAEVAKDKLNKIDEIDLVLGNNEKTEIVDLIEEFTRNRINNCIVSDVNKQKEYLDFDVIFFKR